MLGARNLRNCDSIVGSRTIRLLTISGLLVFPPPASANPNCGDTLSGVVALDTDLDCSSLASGAALTLESGATLAMNGHTVVGPGAGSNVKGIALTGDRAKIVGPGRLKGFLVGVQDEAGAANVKIQRLLITRCTFGMGDRTGSNGWQLKRVLVSAGGEGIILGGSNHRLKQCTVSGNTGSGLTVLGGSITIDKTRLHGNRLGSNCSENGGSQACADLVDDGSGTLLRKTVCETSSGSGSAAALCPVLPKF